MSAITIYYAAGKERAESDRLLAHCAKAFTGTDRDWTPRRPSGGKPFFPDCPQAPFFSVTHSGRYWMCAMSMQPVGLDLQVHQSCPVDKISRRFLHPDEHQWLAESNYCRFFDLWAAKESYLKFTGQGIVGGLDHFCLVADGAIKGHHEGVSLVHLEFQAGYSLFLCAKDTEDIAFCELR